MYILLKCALMTKRLCMVIIMVISTAQVIQIIFVFKIIIEYIIAIIISTFSDHVLSLFQAIRSGGPGSS